MERVLVTGAGSWVGGHCVRRLESQVDVMAVDEIEPRLEFGSPFQRFSLDSLEFAHFVLDVDPTVVLHLQTLDRSAELGASRARDGSVLGAQALFGAVARSSRIRHVVVKSDAAIYSTGPRHASILDERTVITGRATRYERNLREIERFVQELDRELPSVSFTVLRLASIIGPTVLNPLSRYLSLPVVPTALGHDPRLQFVYETDAVDAFLAAIGSESPGVFNVAGSGSTYLHRALRRGRRLPQPLPPPQLRRARALIGTFSVRLPDHLGNLLKYGRHIETSRMEQVLGFSPQRSSPSALHETLGGA